MRADRAVIDGFVFRRVRTTYQQAMVTLFGEAPHCHGNQIDYNFYWNSFTQAPQVEIRNTRIVPDDRSAWRTRYGMDEHGRGGFSPEAYRQEIFRAAYPYEPTGEFLASNPGRALPDLPWPLRADFLGSPLPADHRIMIGHIQFPHQ